MAWQAWHLAKEALPAALSSATAAPAPARTAATAPARSAAANTTYEAFSFTFRLQLFELSALPASIH
jgi:hypothetical protein